MTCIVALEQDGVVYVGADSAGIDAHSLSIVRRADEKVFVTDDGEFIMGFCGSYRIGQLLRYSLDLPEQLASKDDMAYMVTDFIDAVRAIQRDKGALNKDGDHNVESQDAAFIVGYRGRIYVIEQDFQVGRPVDDFAAVGCGDHLALGAMHATRKDKKLTPEERITMALEAATEYSAGVRPPFHVVRLEAPGDA